jgi:hypothetical protein
MFDQFHQSMLLMVQTFGALHRDQMGMIRDELNRVREISQELLSLQADLAGQPAALSARRGSPDPAEPAAVSPGAPVSPATPSLAAPAAGNGSGPEVPDSPPTPAGGGGGAPPAAPAAPASPGRGQTPEDLHTWLNQRIAAIQQERQGRWQKILNFLRGQRPPAPLP